MKEAERCSFAEALTKLSESFLQCANDFAALAEKAKPFFEEDDDGGSDRDDDGNYWGMREDDEPPQSDSFCEDVPKWQFYQGALQNVANGDVFQMLLLGKGYRFDEWHAVGHIVLDEFDGEGYQRVFVALDPRPGMALLPDDVIFKSITGTVYGTALVSDRGPICYLSLRETFVEKSDYAIISTEE